MWLQERPPVRQIVQVLADVAAERRI